MVDSNSCLYSFSAKTTPAIKVPSAGESPIASMARAIPITSKSTKAVNISCSPVSAISLKTWRAINRPINIIPAIDIIEGKCVRLSKGDYDTKKVYKEYLDAGILNAKLIVVPGMSHENPVESVYDEALKFLDTR